MTSTTHTTTAAGRDGEVLAALRDALPPELVITDAAVLGTRGADASGAAPSGPALVLVRPTSTAQVAAALRVAHAHRVPVVPQGALSGLAGAASGVAGAILLDLTAMTAIVSIDPVNQSAVVQPGVIVADLAAAVAAHGLFYAPDPASAAIATIGGTIATNAGGMRCVKYGVTRDHVRSLEAVLADGTVVRTRAETVKSVAGLDLTGLLVGSEGTLAVVTEATLSLLPAPGPVLGLTATFASLEDALAAANALVASPHRPSTVEILDEVAVAAIARHVPGSGLPAGAQAWLLVLTDARSGAQDDVAQYTRIVTDAGALTIDAATDPELTDRLLEARRALHGAMLGLRGASRNEDVAVPRQRLGDLIAGVHEVAARHGVVIGTGGHVGDGNLHPVIAFDPADPGQVAAAEAAHLGILALAAELGGTISGEHGIGTEKLVAIEREIDAPLREVQRQIKAAFDPAGILNPGRKLG